MAIVVELNPVSKELLAEMRRWLEQLPDRLRSRLAEAGLLDSRCVAAGKPLTVVMQQTN